MMKPLTKGEIPVLSRIPESTRVAFKNSETVKWKIQSDLNISRQTVDVYWHNFKESGLIEETHGFVRRTIDGDKALDSVGHMEHAATVGRG
jgi:predicted transcriptional regulator